MTSGSGTLLPSGTSWVEDPALAAFRGGEPVGLLGRGGRLVVFQNDSIGFDINRKLIESFHYY